MQAPAKLKSWRDVAVDDYETTSPSISRPSQADHGVENNSDEDYQSIIKSNKRQKDDSSRFVDDRTNHTLEVDISEASEQQLERNVDEVEERQDEAQVMQSDADWLRSRTSRLLGLLDDDEEDRYKQNDESASDESASKCLIQQTSDNEPQQAGEIASNEAPSSENQQDDVTPVNADEKAIRKSKRLFLRNLPYSVTEDDLREQFEPFDGLEEVRYTLYVYALCLFFL